MNYIAILTIIFLASGYPHVQPVSGNTYNRGQFSYTHNKGQLTNLYNQKVSSLQEYRRPLNIKPIFGVNVADGLNKIGINHRGQVATMENGNRYLVHKGPNFGVNSQTVVVDAKHMSNQWKPSGGSIQPGHRNAGLGDLVKTGGSRYNSFCSNCIRASNQMGERFRQGK